ncbi:hypothetical protein GF324_10985, partial [bacterium]|nr:hypothetical protein [bacterium]
MASRGLKSPFRRVLAAWEENELLSHRDALERTYLERTLVGIGQMLLLQTRVHGVT